jgi:hypothetical protein
MTILADSSHRVLHFSENFISAFQIPDSLLTRDYRISQIISSFEDDPD